MSLPKTHILLLFLVSVGVGCAGSRLAENASSAPPLDGTAWRLTAFGDAVSEQPPPGDAGITIVFSDSGRVAGKSGCNQYFGTFASDGEALTISGIGSTLMACAPPAMERESAFLAALEEVRGWQRTDDGLVLTDAAGEPLLHFTRSEAPRQATLTGTVTYLPRIALPPDAVVRVFLEDVSLADALALVLAEQTIRTEGRQVPIPFRLTYDAARIEPGHRYAVRAEIRDEGGALRWITDTIHPVLTQGAPSDSMMLRVVQVNSLEGNENVGGMTPQPTGQTAVFECAEGGFSFTVRTGPGELAVWLPERFGRRYLVLGQVRAASGAKYEGDGVVVWNKGNEALIEVDGQTFSGCTSNPQRAVWEEAKRQGVDFRAIGQEPGWMLDIRDEQRLSFVYAYGEQEVVMPASSPTVTAGRTVYRARTEAHDLLVTILDEACIDVMSGEPFEATVTVVLDGETYRGCGRSLR